MRITEQCSRLLGVVEPTVNGPVGPCPLCQRPGPWKTTQQIEINSDGVEIPQSDPECRHQLQAPDGRLVWVPGVRFDYYLLPALYDCNVSEHDDFCYTCGVWHDCKMWPWDVDAIPVDQMQP